MFAIGFISYCFLTKVFIISSVHTEKEKNLNF